MPQLRHVGITTHDVAKTAKFSVDVFGRGRWDEAADPRLDVVAYTAPPRERAHRRTRRGPAMEYVGIDLHKK
jgi:hypothetical protein